MTTFASFGHMDIFTHMSIYEVDISIHRWIYPPAYFICTWIYPLTSPYLEWIYPPAYFIYTWIYPLASPYLEWIYPYMGGYIHLPISYICGYIHSIFPVDIPAIIIRISNSGAPYLTLSYPKANHLKPILI